MSRKGRINEFGEFIRNSTRTVGSSSSTSISSYDDGAFLGIGFVLFIISLPLYFITDFSFGDSFLIALVTTAILLSFAEGSEGFAQVVVYGGIYSIFVYGSIWLFS